jgi:hypothetical protein
MAYSDLTPAQQEDIQSVLQIVRPTVGTMRQTVGMWREVLALYNSGASDFRQAMNLMASADAIPNVSGLAGASSVTKAEITNPVGGILADMQAVVTTWEEASRLALCVKLAGINAQG